MSTTHTLIADLEAIPLADMTERDQLTFAAAIGHLRRLSDRVHTLEISQHRTAEKIDELERENAALREFTSNADRAMRFVKLVAGQKLSKQASEWYAGEFGDEGEPDFEGAYDSFIQDARNILNDSVRAAALAGSGEK